MTAIKASDVDRFIARPDPGQPIVLVFGPDAGLRDAENRAAESIAENIRSRLASYFVAGT